MMAMQDANELERMLAQKAQEKVERQRRHRAIAQAVDREGQVTVWDLQRQAHRCLWPVDAAEAIRLGTAVLKGQEPAPEPQAAPAVETPPEASPVKPARGKGKAPTDKAEKAGPPEA